MELMVVAIDKPTDVNLILGQSHFIKTVEDLHEALVNSVPGISFGLAFCESSGPRLVRRSGTDADLTALAVRHMQAIGAGHTFLIMLGNAFPLNVLNAIKGVPEVCHIFCATANPVEVVVGQTDLGRGILGVIDGQSPLGVEDDTAAQQRKEFLRTIGYKQ
jgi:adenosine/AMP kinase